MLERITKLIKLKKISSSKFADEIGVQRSSVSHVLSGRNKPSLDFVQKILIHFPEINAEWLLLGKGEILQEESQTGLFKKDRQEAASSLPPDVHGQTNQQLPMPAAQRTNPDSVLKPQNPAQKKNKDIERVIVFYADKTCAEYFPEK